MVEIAALQVRVTSDGIEATTSKVDKFADSATKANVASDRLGKTGSKTAAANLNVAGSADRAAAATSKVSMSANSATGSFNRMSQSVTGVAGSLGRVALAATGGFLAAFSVGTLGQIADAWSDMQSRIGAAVKDMEAAPAIMQRIVDVANASYSPLAQTAETFGRNVTVLRELGKNTNQAADFTESLNHMLVLTATRGERAASVQDALSKAMAVGKLQADGLETVLANGGEVAQALAQELGTTVNGLRGFASQGKITGEVIANAIIKPLDDVRARAAEMPATISDAFVRISTNFTALVGGLDQITGASASVASAIISVADGIRFLSQNIGTLAQVVAVGGLALSLAFGPSILSAMAVSFGYLGAAGVAAFNAITVAAAANPFGALLVGITAAVAAAFYFRDEIQKAIGVDVVGIVKGAANTVIGSFVAAYEDIKFVWSQFPNIIGAAVFGAVNGVIDGVNAMVSAAKDGINTLISAVNNIPGVDIGMLDPSQGVEKINNPYAEALSSGVGERNSAVNAAMSKDYIGAIGSAFTASTPAAQNFTTAVNGAAAANDNLGKSAGGAAQKTEDAYAKLVSSAQEFIAQQQLEQQALGMTEQAANKLRYEQDMLNQAANDNISLTAAQRAEISGLASQMAATEAETNRLREAFDFAKEATGSFLTDLRTGLKNGEGFFKSFANAASNLLDKVINKIQDELVNALFSMGGAGAGGGGFLSSLLGGLSSIFGFANGGAFGAGGVQAFAKGGAFTNQVVSSPTMFKFAKGTGLMGEAGPEAIMPLGRDASGKLGVYARGGASGGGEVKYVEVPYIVSVQADDDGSIKAMMKQVSGETVQQAAPSIVKAANQSAPTAVAQYQQTKQGGDYRNG